MAEIREKWLNEPYETRNKSTSCRLSGKVNVLDNLDVFYSQWAEYIEEYDSNFSMN